MADPLSVAASVVTVAALAYHSARTLYLCISDDAPEALVFLRGDIELLFQMIHSLQQTLESNTDACLSEAQKSNLREIKPALEACHVACFGFKAKLDSLTRHSAPGSIGLRDRLRIQLKDKEITAFHARISSYKATLAIALEFSSFKTASENLDVTRSLEEKLEKVTSLLIGQMQGLQISLQVMLDANVDDSHSAEPNDQNQLTEAQQGQVLRAIEQQSIALTHCYRACMAAFKETTKATGHSYKYVKASDEARLLMGDLGNVKGGRLHSFSNIEVTGGWVVAGNMAGENAKDFFR